MDNWQPPIEAEAYRVRSSNTITSKDRLLDYCELASLNDNGYMEPENLSFNTLLPEEELLQASNPLHMKDGHSLHLNNSSSLFVSLSCLRHKVQKHNHSLGRYKFLSYISLHTSL